MINFWLNKIRMRNIILNQIRKRNQILYGAKAINMQIPHFLHIPTEDYDIYTRNPKATANFMQRKLDKEIYGGKDVFYSIPAEHKGTHKVMHKGQDGIRGTKDDFGVIDYTVMPKGLLIKKINQIKVERLKSIIATKRKILKDKASQYRHHKDIADLDRIFTYQTAKKIFGIN